MPENFERDIYSVTRLNREARLLLEAGIPALWLEAELSNLTTPASGHWYFTLKDREAQIRCTMWRARNQLLKFRPKEGQLLRVRGRVGLYEPRGDFQLQVEFMEDAGEGALQREFEKLKAKLAAEGLFDERLKRPLPAIPKCLAVITSPTGAAIRDVLSVLARRFPAVRVIVHPVPVQGNESAPALVAALHSVAQRGECDVVLLTRGGGSLEDLWSFNDEHVARAIRACPVPVVTGIGHEIDFTIADFAADLRAPTPSVAAERVVPDRAVLFDQIDTLKRRMGLDMERLLSRLRERYVNLAMRLNRAHPGARLTQHMQRLDELELRLRAAWRSQNERLSQRLESVKRELNAVSPLATLQRGYAIVTGSDGQVLIDSADVKLDDTITARLARGSVMAKVIGKA